MGEARAFLRACFGKDIHATQIPLEIWGQIVLETSIKDISTIAQMCKGFAAVVEYIRARHFEIALLYRREDQMRLAHKCLMMCVEMNNPDAMFHIGYAMVKGGWRIDWNEFWIEDKRANEWITKAAEMGNTNALLYISKGVQHEELPDKKDGFVDGIMAIHYKYFATDIKKSNYYVSRGANRGDYWSQKRLSAMYRFGEDVELDEVEASKWHKRACSQEFLANFRSKDNAGIVESGLLKRYMNNDDDLEPMDESDEDAMFSDDKEEE